MLRLWPERLVALVQPDVCRLYRAGGKEIGQCPTAVANSFSLPDALSLLLDRYRTRRDAEIELIVSDSLARLISLPWQDNISNGQQREAYARACFDHAGFELDDEWLVYAAYRHFRGTGLGYALPRVLVSDIRDRLLERRIRLRSVMPNSAYAYWRNGSGSHGKRTVLLLRERTRLSALLFDGRKCAGIHVQPIGAGVLNASRRLLSTIDATFPSVSRIHLWSPGSDDKEAELIKNATSMQAFEVLPELAWK